MDRESRNTTLNGHLFLLLGMNMILTTNCVIRLIGLKRMVRRLSLIPSIILVSPPSRV
jgi:hypothetical protein